MRLFPFPVLLLISAPTFLLPQRDRVFVAAFSILTTKPTPTTKATISPFPTTLENGKRSLQIRGGALHMNVPAVVETVSTLVQSNVQSGPYGVVALTALASAVCLPITQYKYIYGISVGYGLSIFTIAIYLRSVFAPVVGLIDCLTAAAAFYGIRLAAFLLLRDATGWVPRRSNAKETPRLNRIPFALSVSLFYACLTTPLLYLVRNSSGIATGSVGEYITLVASVLAWSGALLEAIADAHKFVVYSKESTRNSKEFQGPTGGAYGLTRHPNYTGEIMFWFGIWLAGVPALGMSIVGWLSGTAGLFGILSIMNAATAGLEKRQAEKYQGQDRYENWKRNVPATLIPFVSGK